MPSSSSFILEKFKRPSSVFVLAAVGLLALVLLVFAALLLRSTRGSPTSEGCYVITDQLGVPHRSTRVPQYNTVIDAVQWQTSTSEGTILDPVSVQADYACLDANPAPTSEVP